MSMLILLIAATSCLSVSAQGCFGGVQSSAHITIYSDIFEFHQKLNELKLFRKLVENLGSSCHVVLYSYDAERLMKTVDENRALEGIHYSVTEDYITEYVNSMTWQPSSTSQRTSRIVILIMRHLTPLIFMYPKIHKLKRAGVEIFTLVYDVLKRHGMDEVASYPAEWHSYSRLNFQSIDDAAEVLSRSVCRGIEEKELGAKKALLSDVRLAGGSGPCQGRVELLYNRTWGALSDEHWDRRAADVICRQLKCGPSTGALKGDAFGAGHGHFLEKVDCTGDEADISQCLLGTWTEKDHERSLHNAEVTCLSSGVGGVRLVDGSGRCNGTVEVSVNNVWRRLSLWNFDMREGAVICRELGCGPLLRVQEVFSSGGKTVERSRCFGTESEFSQCRISLWKAEPHVLEVHAAVVCSETELSKVSLVSEDSTCAGKVKIFSDNVWSTVCAMEWGPAEEAVLCREKGCGPALEPGEVKKVDLIRGDAPITHFRNVHCAGSESSLTQCSAVVAKGYRCYSREATATCSQAEMSAVRLEAGGHRCSGRVEVRYKKRWGSVCDQDWDLSDAQVVCRQVGCGPAVQALGGAYFGRGSGDIWLEKIFCNGTEAGLSQCGAVMSKKSLCDHSQDASVICEEKAQE